MIFVGATWSTFRHFYWKNLHYTGYQGVGEEILYTFRPIHLMKILRILAPKQVQNANF